MHHTLSIFNLYCRDPVFCLDESQKLSKKQAEEYRTMFGTFGENLFRRYSRISALQCDQKEAIKNSILPHIESHQTEIFRSVLEDPPVPHTPPTSQGGRLDVISGSDSGPLGPITGNTCVFYWSLVLIYFRLCPTRSMDYSSSGRESLRSLQDILSFGLAFA